MASRLIELKKALGDSENLLLVAGSAGLTPADDAGMRSRDRRVIDAKQQMYLALIKAGWTKDEIYSMAGINPPANPAQMPPPTAGRLPGNLKKIGQ